MTDKPNPLATLTQLPQPKPGTYTRRARYRIPGERANNRRNLPPIIPAQKAFRINPDPPDDPGYDKKRKKELKEHRAYARAVIRKWGRRNGWTVKNKGKLPAGLVDAFMEENDIWTVYIRRALLPGATDYAAFYQVKQGIYLRTLEHGKSETVDVDKIRRVMGNDMFNLLWQVKT